MPSRARWWRPAPPVVRLAHDGPRDVVFTVPEDRVGELRVLAGKAGALQVHVWNDGQTPISATMREVAAAADPATRTFMVKADIGRADVRLGQTATVKIEMPAWRARSSCRCRR